MSLGTQIKKYRDLHGWTLEKLSERALVDVGTISALEVRKSKRSEKASAIAKALGLTVEQLLDEESDYSSLAATMVVSGEVKEREAVYRLHNSPWPFKHISNDEWGTLNDLEKGMVEGYVRRILDGDGSTRKGPKDPQPEGYSARLHFPKR
ncbi:helix-turn-helix domain-containing protein [Xylophilus ampelinus]|uniref:DNA-binding XRE family transcriptional regulator n=1 Tax=Xylophilus ampelinus TaxID=54067 RepID=A0A318SKX7_9BURK|nr:helix-turn-helix transcriptional regulator [Xylophilus ampelinus]MCS4509160.1 helix-turn-helix domain-containing protein [Xylophilus ampelinus]PYE79814.1 DNA-binding XRE family transcriptional regulator [Xylophilus ampelinus]